MQQDVDPESQDRPHTMNVLVLLASVAAIFSYLGAYALTNALVAADLIDRWPVGRDPRPRWMLEAFVTMLGAFVLLGGWLRWSSNRQMKRMDTMEQIDG